MKFRLFLFSVICFYSCSAPAQETTEIVKKEVKVGDSKPDLIKSEQLQNDSLRKRQIECEAYWDNRLQLNGLKNQYLDEILTDKKLSPNNRRFLTALRNEKGDDLGYKKPVSAIFRFSRTEIGITVSPKYSQEGSSFKITNKEQELLTKYDTTGSVKGSIDEIRFYPTVFASFLAGKPSPTINYYSTTGMGTTTLKAFGSYGDECADYYQYSLNTQGVSINEKLLFGSPFVIDLEFENYPEIDVLLQNSHKEECLDCPNSVKLQKTFAKVKSTDNVYFVYAETFPINNTLDTPSRALVLINKKKEVIYLWYDEIDLFGCSCL